jgi:hypothetical protein
MRASDARLRARSSARTRTSSPTRALDQVLEPELAQAHKLKPAQPKNSLAKPRFEVLVASEKKSSSNPTPALRACVRICAARTQECWIFSLKAPHSSPSFTFLVDFSIVDRAAERPFWWRFCALRCDFCSARECFRRSRAQSVTFGGRTFQTLVARHRFYIASNNPGPASALLGCFPRDRAGPLCT